MQKKVQARRHSSGPRRLIQPPKPRAARAHRAATPAAITPKNERADAIVAALVSQLAAARSIGLKLAPLVEGARRSGIKPRRGEVLRALERLRRSGRVRRNVHQRWIDLGEAAPMAAKLRKTPLFRNVALLTSGPDLPAAIQYELQRGGIVAVLIAGEAKPWRIRWIEDPFVNRGEVTAEIGARDTDEALAKAGISLRGIAAGEMKLPTDLNDGDFMIWDVELAASLEDLSPLARDLTVACRAYELFAKRIPGADWPQCQADAAKELATRFPKR